MMPSNGAPLRHQCEIDREFVAAGDKFLGAVKRIDQEKASGVARLGQMDAFLGKRWNLGHQPRKALGENAVGGQVRFRHRRSVELAVDLHRRAVDGENGRAGPDHQVGQGFHQRSRFGTVDQGCGGTGVIHLSIHRRIHGGFHGPLNCPLSILALCWQRARPQCIKPASMCDSPWCAMSAGFQEHPMSGISSPGPAPDALELAALLCSRVCHDLISPVGAIVNGLEVLDDDPKPEDREFALDLIRKSAKTASARLQFCRLAFGAAGSSGAQIDLGDAQNMARGHLEDGKTTITWNLPRAAVTEEQGQAAAQHAGDRATDHPARRRADGRSDRRRRQIRLSRRGQRTERPHAAKYRRSAQCGLDLGRSMPMRCSPIIRGCWRRPAGFR